MSASFIAHTIPHETHRYETCGDWNVHRDGFIAVFASAMGNKDYEFLVQIHELIEAYLCAKRGISDEDVTTFDKSHPEEEDPGSHPDAPYRKEHLFATAIERQIADELGVDWDAYEKAIQEL